MRVGFGMKKHWRKESQYADIAAVWRLVIGREDYGEHNLESEASQVSSKSKGIRGVVGNTMACF